MLIVQAWPLDLLEIRKAGTDGAEVVLMKLTHAEAHTLASQLTKTLDAISITLEQRSTEHFRELWPKPKPARAMKRPPKRHQAPEVRPWVGQDFTKPAVPAPPKVGAVLLTLEEVAKECRTAVASVRLWIRTGRLRSVRPGRRRLVHRGDLEQFLARDVAEASEPQLASLRRARAARAPRVKPSADEPSAR
jgi:excisionase family DNA binding protein